MCGLQHDDPAATPRAGTIASLLIEVGGDPAEIMLRDARSGDTIARIDDADNEILQAVVEHSRGGSLSHLVQAAIGAELPAGPVEWPRGHALARGFADQLAGNENQPTKKSRRKLWELAHKLHCPVIGTCLEADELRRIARKAQASAPGRLTDYEVHVSFVATAETRNALSLATHKTLEKKYAAHVRRFAKAKSADALTGLWRDALASGDVPGALWAAVTHPRCDDELKARLFEEVHMLSHQIGAGQRADLRRLAATEQRLGALQRDFDQLTSRSHQQLEGREQRITALEKQLRDNEQTRLALLAENSRLGHDLAELRCQQDAGYVDKLEDALAVSERRLGQVQQEREQWILACESAEKQVCELENALDERQADCDALERFITQTISTTACCGANDAGSCPNLNGQRILCVGGRQRMIDQYRELVARFNGEFEHHDGGVEHSRQRLESLLSSADAVVCATDCVSHDAYYRLKRFCKRHDKPHVFLRNSGLSTFTRALYNVVQ